MKQKMKALTMCALLLLCSLAGCGNKGKWVFRLDNQKISYSQVLSFGYIFAKEHNMKDKMLLEELTSDGTQTYEEYYKEEFRQELIDTMLFAAEAETKGVSLSEEDKKEIKKELKALQKKYGKEYLKNQKVEEADLTYILERRCLARHYRDSFKEDSKGETGEEHYIKVYQTIFPTVELDEEGLMIPNQDGSLNRIDLPRRQELKEQAENYVLKIREGEDMARLRKELDDSVTDGELYLKYEDLDAQYKKVIDSLKVGEVSDCFELEYGYYVVKLLDKEVSDYKELLESQEQLSKQQEALLQEKNRLYNAHVGSDTEYKNQEVWDSISMKQFIP